MRSLINIKIKEDIKGGRFMINESSLIGVQPNEVDIVKIPKDIPAMDIEDYDLFDDKSMLLTKVNGHAKGQICCLIQDKVFLGADSSWGNSFVGKANDFKFFPRLIQSDMNDYITNDKLLKRMRKDGIKLCFSHDTYEDEVIKL